MPMRTLARRLAIPTLVMAAVLFAAPLASASGSGYNLNFSQASNGGINSGVDLVALSSSDNGAGKLTISFTVAGSVVTTNSAYIYDVYFGGSSASTATGYFLLTNNSTVGTLITSASGGGGFGYAAYTISGSSLSFLVNTSSVGASSTFTLNAAAVFSGPSGDSVSYLGSAYNGGGGGNCNAAGCIPTSNVATNFFSGLILIALVFLVVIVVIIVVVVVVVVRKKPGPPPMGWSPAPGQPMAPPPPPPPMGQPPAPPPPGTN
jgi:hypothetical protein